MLLIAVAIVSLALAGCGSSSSDSGGGKLSVAATFQGTPKDTYNQTAIGALKKAAEETGADSPRIVTGVPYTQQATQIIQQLFAGGTQLLVDNQSLGDLLYQPCSEAPEKDCATFYSTSKVPGNVTTFQFDYQNAYYVEGYVAGQLTKSNVVGYIGAFDDNLNTSNVNSIALGCLRANPNCKVQYTFLNTYYEPPKAIEAANGLIDGGADVLVNYVDDTSVPKVAENRGVRVFGIYTNQMQEAPNAWVSGILTEPALTTYFTNLFRSSINGSFKPQIEVLGFKQGLELAKFNNVPAKAAQSGERLVSEIEAGKNVFTGPMYDQHGKLKVKEGESLSSSFLYDEWSWKLQNTVGG
jgi:simple sugar transport system substrate-binding protein